jgi:RraA family protein
MDLAEIRTFLTSLDTACFCDADKDIRVLDPAIRPIRDDLKLVGRAHTVRCRDDFLTVIQALKEAEPGEVLVVDGQGGERALAGELFATEAARKELAGLVIDGAVRDVRTIRRLELPVYSRLIYPNAGTTRQIAETQVSITCGGVKVRPGEIVFGDQDGVVVLSEEELSSLLPKAREIQQKEEQILARMAEGKSLLDMVNFDEHFENIAARKPSKLEFIL